MRLHACNVFSMTKYLTEMIVWISLLTVKKSNQHILFEDEAMWLRNAPLLEYNFLKAVPGSVQHNTAVDSVTKVPIISGKELKSMKNDLQFTSRTPFRRPTVKSHRSWDREPSRIYISSLKFRKLRSKVKNVLKKSVPASSVLHNRWR